MELRQLRTFIAVAEEGTFTSAADRLVVVQSAVSATIRALERELGAALFERTTRRVELTDAGRALLPEAHRTLEAATLAADAVDQVKGGVRGTVSVGIMQSPAGHSTSVPGLIARFQEAHPLVSVSARHVGGSRVLAEHVRDGDIDLGFLSLPGEFPGLNLTELRREPMMLACPPGHRLAERESVSIQELAGEPFVDGPAEWGTHLAADELLAAAGVTRTIRFEVNDMVSIVQFVAEGLAVGFFPPSFAEFAPAVVMVPIEGEPPYFRTLLATPSGRRPRAAVSAFAEFVIASAPNPSVRDSPAPPGG